jgi:hypothetical protein
MSNETETKKEDKQATTETSDTNKELLYMGSTPIPVSNYLILD